MQIVRNFPRHVNLPKFSATLVASDNPLASTYPADNFFPTFSHSLQYVFKFSAILRNSFFCRKFYNFERPPTH